MHIEGKIDFELSGSGGFNYIKILYLKFVFFYSIFYTNV